MSKYIALPKGVAEADFDKAIAEFKKILGAGNVLHTRERLAPYLKIMIPAPIEEHTPSAAIMPESVEQIQRILRVCNRYKTPVWPISTGKNFGYGSAAPATRGQIVLDLKRLNRIIEVDPDLCFAVVEPGVTYQQLYDYIKERNLPLWLDPPIPGPVASPLGNTVERGVGYTPYGEHFLFSCGMEVALANGDILRTGMGSMPNSNTWQVFKWGYGPSLDGIFTQSNFGIVTKLGIWLMPAPPAYKPFVVRYPDPADIVKAIETVRPLRIAQVIPNAGTVSNALWELAVVNRRSRPLHGCRGDSGGDGGKAGEGAWRRLLECVYGLVRHRGNHRRTLEDRHRRLQGLGRHGADPGRRRARRSAVQLPARRDARRDDHA
jgi:4-cresol dehydrogenase (hydroxylating)